jgi:Tol biopolymer transport system component/DNA-binding winged helix-turn-helix (wHTH) protein
MLDGNLSPMALAPLPFPAGYAFGPFVIDTVRRTIREGDRPVVVHSKAFEVLVTLIAERERVVPKEDLLARIWPDTFVQENNLPRHVSTLRKVLGESPERSNWILTVPGRGYRFIAPVVELDAHAPELRGHLPHTPAPAQQVPVAAAPAQPALPHLITAERANAAPAGPHPARRRWLTPVSILVASSAVAIATFVAVRTVLTPESASAPRPWMLQQVTYGPNTQINPAWSPDGQSVAFASDRDGNFNLFVQRLDGSEPVRLTSAAGDELEPAWSPNGQSIVYRSNEGGGGIYVIPAAGGPARRIAPMGFEPQWSPDGTRVLLLSSIGDRPSPRIQIANSDGRGPGEFRPGLDDQLKATAAAWHPDGQRVSVTGVATGTWQWTFMTVPVGGGEPIVSEISPAVRALIQEYDLHVGRFAWNRAGTRLFFEGRSQDATNIWTVGVDPASLRWIGPLERLSSGPGLDQHLTVSPDGRRIAFESAAERTRIWAYHLDETAGTLADHGHPVTPGAAGEFDAAVSPDGRRLVYRTERSGQQELWQLSLTDGDLVRLVADPLRVRSAPRWSPDGSTLTYLISPRLGPVPSGRADFALGVLPSSGGPERLVRTSLGAEITPDDWSADGQFVLGACRPRQRDRLAVCLVPVSGIGPSKVLVADPDHDLHNARFSPDQQWITFTRSARGGVSTVCVRRTSGGSVVELTDGTTFEDKAHWSPDGRSVYFVSNRDGFLNVWGRRWDPKTGVARGEVFQVTHFDSPGHQLPARLQSVDVALARNQLFVPVTETTGQIWMLKDMAR